MLSLFRLPIARRLASITRAAPVRALGGHGGGHGGDDHGHAEEEFYVDHDNVYHVEDPLVELWKRNLPTPVPFPVYPVIAANVEWLLPMPIPQHVFEEPMVHIVAYPKNWQSMSHSELEELVHGPAEDEH
eukprot:TRINITY_DN16617_c0_g1_i1.p3 TRINITY_DN16617_c0_g1~~TRINITY_DN16617_c0_g1_i1.p3  ORF type:complete len:130 (+),score=20.00 TRINITY_DN16617_c0_g1_i1:502-891(+)